MSDDIKKEKMEKIGSMIVDWNNGKMTWQDLLSNIVNLCSNANTNNNQ